MALQSNTRSAYASRACRGLFVSTSIHMWMTTVPLRQMIGLRGVNRIVAEMQGGRSKNFMKPVHSPFRATERLLSADREP